MDQNFAEIIIVVITGIFSVLSIIVQKKQDKVVDSIDKKSMFIEKERGLKKNMDIVARERESIIHDMMILIMESNIQLMKDVDSSRDSAFHDELYKNAIDLKKRFEDTNSRLEDINKEYDLVIEMAREAQKEIEQIQKKK